MGYKERLARRAMRRGWTPEELDAKIAKRTTVRKRTGKFFKALPALAAGVAVDFVPLSGMVSKIPGVAQVVGRIPGAESKLQAAADAMTNHKTLESFLFAFIRDILPWQTIKKVYDSVMEKIDDLSDWLEDYDQS